MRAAISILFLLASFVYGTIAVPTDDLDKRQGLNQAGIQLYPCNDCGCNLGYSYYLDYPGGTGCLTTGPQQTISLYAPKGSSLQCQLFYQDGCYGGYNQALVCQGGSGCFGTGYSMDIMSFMCEYTSI